MKPIHLLTLGLLFACQPPSLQQVVKQPLILKGQVSFPLTFKAQASSQTPYLSTVSLIYPSEHPTKARQTLATGNTDEAGQFTLTLPADFDDVNTWFILEASRRQNSQNQRQRQSLQSWVKPLSNGWQSLSGPNVQLTPESTALSLLLQWNNLSAENFTQSLSTSAPITYTVPLTEVNAPEQISFVNTTTAVTNALFSHLDPIAHLSPTDPSQYTATVPPTPQILQETLYCPYCELEGADLSGSNLNLSQLTGANLQYANLSSSQLMNATLDNVQLTGARLDQATWINGQTCKTPSTSICTFEQRVSEDPNVQQKLPRIDTDAKGNFIMTWVSTNYSGQSLGIYARRYNALGVPLDIPFRVDDQNTGQANTPDIAVHDSGRFIIVWQDNGPDPSGNGLDIYGRWYTAEGEPEGEAFRINSDVQNDQKSPKVALDQAGNTVVAWNSFVSPRSLMFRRFNTAKEPMENDTVVNPTQALDHFAESDLAMNAQGDFAFTWAAFDSQTLANVYIRTFNASGQALSSEVLVNQTLPFDQKAPAVALSNTGELVVSWQSGMQDEAGFDTRPGGTGTGIYARRFQDNGTPLDDEFRVNRFIQSQQDAPAITMDQNGRFVIAWQSWGHDYSTAPDLFLQRFSATGNFIGTETPVNVRVSGTSDQYIALAAAADTFTMAWERGFFSTVYTQTMGWDF